MTSDSVNTIPVSEFIELATKTINANFSSLWVSGEIANFTMAASGHWYFVLRDQSSQMDCVMFARENKLVNSAIKSGDKVVLFGKPTLYPARGRFQFSTQLMEIDGVGHLYTLFLQRKKQWHERGWFSAEHKKALPLVPQSIGVVSSTAGAALKDVLHTIAQRFPAVTVIVYPSPAQGSDAAHKIAEAINIANQRLECDLLIVCRGGGGIEDLWAYNEEAVVAAIVNSNLPIITGIGHEIDETLADYAADYHAVTPTAAAVAAVPVLLALIDQLQDYVHRLQKNSDTLINNYTQQLDWAIKLMASPMQLIDQKKEALHFLQIQLAMIMQQFINVSAEKIARQEKSIRQPNLLLLLERFEKRKKDLQQAMQAQLINLSNQLLAKETSCRFLSPHNVLKRGYSIVYNDKGDIISDWQKIQSASTVRIDFNQGQATASVLTVKKNNSHDPC